MKSSEKDNYVKYRIEKAEETYEAAELLAKNKKWNSVVNRLYYAAYYGVSGLLVMEGIQTKTHSGVKTQFFMNFVKTERIDIGLAKLYSDLFDSRQKGDYGDFFDFTEEDVKSLLIPTRKLIDAIKREIEKDK
jgi:uncharacterized protein (UPF0332 family)